MGYTYGYDAVGSAATPGVGALIWIIIALLAALVGCFLIYFLFVKKDTKLENKKLAWLREFLRFDRMLVETVLKILYIFIAIAITLVPFAFVDSFGSFIAILLFIVFGNIFIRIGYELAMIKIMIWKNTTEIKKNMK